MKKILFVLLFTIIFPIKIYAVEDPLKLPNNKIGIHILFDNELIDAAKFVNSEGGDWGYVTIPIQIGDRDLIKWQHFMDKARLYHVIPLIRLASSGDYFNTNIWEKPSPEHIIDFANFLDSLVWPTKNRYIIVFNETNRADEWGGTVNPEEYAKLLSFAVSMFKSKSQDFFMISAGLDNAAPDQYPDYMNEYTYMRKMQQAVPGIFNQIDAFASHSYPNPGFTQHPSILTSKSISSFKYERELIREFRNLDIPVFITETGWNSPFISPEMKSLYFMEAFAQAWADTGIVAITPFLLRAGSGPFTGFSFLKHDGFPTTHMEALMKMPKIAGKPLLAPLILGIDKQQRINYPKRDFSKNRGEVLPAYSMSDLARQTFKWMMKL